jgi:TP901 family phage tail tape measure protein
MTVFAAVTVKAASRALVGLGRVAVRTFRTMWRIGKRTLRSLKTGLGGLGRAAGLAGGAMRTAAMGMLPLSYGMMKGVKTAAAFEKQMSAVSSITQASSSDMKKLEAFASEMGIKTQFSAMQAGQGMEFLARAGAKPQQIIDALRGTMAAAAADGMDLGEASDIVANIVKGMGLEWKEAAHVADVLALTSARTNTNISQLGESFKYGMAQAKIMGLSLEETAAMFGKIADAGNKASVAGTGFTNMLIKMSKPSKKTQEELNKWGVDLDRIGKESGNVAVVLDEFMKRLSKIPSATKRAKMMTEIFGIRGQRAFNALGIAGSKATNDLMTQLQNASNVTDKSGKKIGMAAKMAQDRLNNLSGAMTLLGSSVQQASIELFKPLLGPVAESTRNFTDALNEVLFNVKALREDGPATLKQWQDAANKAGTGLTTAQQIAIGFRDAIDWLKQSWDRLTTAVGNFAQWLNEKLGGEGTRSITSLITKFMVVAGILTPILGAVGLFAWILKGTLVPAIQAVGVAFKVALGPVGWIIGGIILAIMAMKKENESLFDVFGRIWGGMKEIINAVWIRVKAFIDGFVQAFKPALQTIGEIFQTVFDIIGEILSWFVDETSDATGKAGGFWSTFGKVVGTVLGVIAEAVKIIIGFVKKVIDGIGDIISGVLDLLGLAAEKQELVKAEYMPVVTELARAGFAQAGYWLGDLKTMEKRRKRMWAHRVAERMSPDQLAKVSAEDRAKMGEDFIAMIKQAWRQKEEAELSRYEDKPIEVKNVLKDERKLEVKNTFCVDRRKMATAVTRHQVEIMERKGTKVVPWQRRSSYEFGVIDLSGAGTKSGG